MKALQADLVIQAGRIFCKDTGLNGPGAVAINSDRILSSGQQVPTNFVRTLDVHDCLLLPGFVDMHAHPAPSTWKYGMNADRDVLPNGTTTVLSQGDAGAATWDQYRTEIIKPSRTRIRLAISPALQGESEDRTLFENLDDIDIDKCVAAVVDGGDSIWGIAVNLSPSVTGTTSPHEVMRRTLAIAELTDKPLLFGARVEDPEWSLADQFALLRAGDVVTYCFRASTQNIVSGDRVIDSAWEARERGVLFDVGHGMRSFDFSIAETAIANGFPPDTISTDFYKRHVELVPLHDMPRTISKLIASGMEETEALERATYRPAAVLDLNGEIGSLAPGKCADLAVLRWNPTPDPLIDTNGNTRPGGCWETVFTVRAGKIIEQRR